MHDTTGAHGADSVARRKSPVGHRLQGWTVQGLELCIAAGACRPSDCMLGDATAGYLHACNTAGDYVSSAGAIDSLAFVTCESSSGEGLLQPSNSAGAITHQSVPEDREAHEGSRDSREASQCVVRLASSAKICSGLVEGINSDYFTMPVSTELPDTTVAVKRQKHLRCSRVLCFHWHLQMPSH